MLFRLALVVLVLSGSVAQASVRAFLIPGKVATLVMEAINMGTGQIDPDPRKLYDAIATPSKTTTGGEGKVITTGDKMFNLVCGTKNSTRDSVLCNVTIKPSTASTISWTEASFVVDGAEAKMLNDKFGAGHAFQFATGDGRLTISSTPEHFEFRYK